MTERVTVGELVEVLSRLPSDLLVEVEGCDCIGWCAGAAVQEGPFFEWDKGQKVQIADRAVLLYRDDGDYLRYEASDDPHDQAPGGQR